MSCVKAFVLHLCQPLAKVCKNLWRKYVVIVAGAILAALLFSYTIPDEYAAQAKIVDEYKTTDLLIGLNQINVMLRDLNANAGNEGTDDIDIYSKFLSSNDFIEKISHVNIPKYQKDYLLYLSEHHRLPIWQEPFHNLFSSAEQREEEVRQLIRKSIQYNISFMEMSVNLQVKDQDPEVASIILYAALDTLKAGIEDFRVKRAFSERENARSKRRAAGEAFRKANNLYKEYAEAHPKPASDYVSSHLDLLQKDSKLKYDLYRKAAEEFVRKDYLVKKENASFFILKKYNLAQEPLTPRHWVYMVVAGIIALFCCICHWRFKQRGAENVLKSFNFGDWFAPWSITLMIWAAVLGLYYILDTELYPLTSQFYYCFAIWIIIFCGCSLLTYNLSATRNTGSITKEHLHFNKYIFTFFFVISLIITPLYVYRVLQIVMMFSSEDLLNNVRTLAVYGEGQGFLNYSNVINQSLFVVALWAHPKVPLWQIVILTLACLLNSLAIMEKGGIFFVFFCLIFVLFEKRIIKFRAIIITGVLLLGFFYLFNLARSGEDSEYQKNETFMDFFAMYALASPVAFCQLMPDVTPQFGANTFGTIYLFLERLGVQDIIVKDKLQEFAWVPIPTNVYTAFHPFYVDFGYQGVAFFAALYGIVTGWLYRLFRNGSSVGCCLYTMAAEVLVLQFYQENVFLSIIFVLQFAFFVILFTQQKIGLIFRFKT